ncbi:MAG: single-stranded DNA-binding protein [Ruminococcus sp.]|nr:single-stranded DNA-binding protein [Ruminococcus sp.]
MNNHEWLDMACNKIKDLPTGTEFELKELFDGIIWNELTAKERQGFGRFFSTAYNDGKLSNIHHINKEKRGPNKYIKC